MRKTLSLAFALLLAPIAVQAALPPPYSASYEVRRNGEPTGTATVVFRALANGRYELRSHTVGSQGLAAIAGVDLDERSILRIVGGAPETVAYSYRQQVAWKNKARDISVDAGAGRITSTDKDKTYSPPYKPGVLDRNAITVALMSDVAAGKPGDLQYLVPSKDELETWTYRSAGTETMQTTIGSQRVIRVERIRDSGNGRSTTLWLGADRNFVPLRMLQKEPDGSTIEMRITSLR
jgi:hypothetical protein